MSRADRYEPLPDDVSALWLGYGRWEREYYPKLLGMTVEDVRRDYCRMRLAFKPSLEQPAGVVHGGAIASLVDSVVVPAIGGAYGPGVGYSTVDLHVQYLAPWRTEDAVAEGWVVQRGRSIVFCEAEVRGATSDTVIARGHLTYKVSQPRTG